ncbi:MAG: hypothetical protein J7K26_02675 [Candidatus Aenigmarchaeota archaeon]|nr:hypothetical protein [Candidatus Aenigmarchaeota archaeon]
MFDKISEIIKKKNLKPTDCEYHTLRTLENGGKLRALVTKAEPNVLHVEYICPKCSHYGYKVMEYKKVSKAAKIRFRVECDKCHFKIKVEKLKAKK